MFWEEPSQTHAHCTVIEKIVLCSHVKNCLQIMWRVERPVFFAKRLATAAKQSMTVMNQHHHRKERAFPSNRYYETREVHWNKAGPQPQREEIGQLPSFEIFKNMFSFSVQHQVTIILYPPGNIRWLRSWKNSVGFVVSVVARANALSLEAAWADHQTFKRRLAQRAAHAL